MASLRTRLVCRILEHLKLWHERLPRGLPPPEAREYIAEAVVCEAFDDGWGRYNEADIPQH